MSLSGVRRRFVPIVLGLLVLALVVGWALREQSSNGSQSSPTATRTHQKRATTAASPTGSHSNVRTIAYADLPSGARATLKLVDVGGPYPFRQDGTVYQNRNKVLPIRGRGYYHEYTVVTPGQGDRGPRRIVVGNNKSAYYTADHYDSFARVLR